LSEKKPSEYIQNLVFTVSADVTASERILTPLLVFKGVPGGKIEKREFATFPKDILYACQGNAWMDEGAMLLWVEKILKPYVETAPDGIVPLLFLFVPLRHDGVCC
jgi:hypothetical protein